MLDPQAKALIDLVIEKGIPPGSHDRACTSPIVLRRATFF